MYPGGYAVLNLGALVERDELETRLEVLLAPGVMREYEDVMDAAAALAHGTSLNLINPAASRSAHGFLELAHKAIRDRESPSGTEGTNAGITNLIAIATGGEQIAPTITTQQTIKPKRIDKESILDEIFDVEPQRSRSDNT